METTRKTIIHEAVEKVLEEHKVPYRIHASVLRSLADKVQDHKKELLAAKADRYSYRETMEVYQKAIRKHEHHIAQWEATIDHVRSLRPRKGDPGEPGKPGRPGQDGIYQDPIALAKLVMSLLPAMPEFPVLPTLDEEKLFKSFVERIQKEKSIDVSHLRNAQSFIFNKKKYKVEELMHGGGSSSGGASANVLTEYDLQTKTQVGGDVVVPLSQLSHFATFSNVIAALHNQIPQTNGITCTITAIDITFLNSDVSDIFSITYAYT